MVSRVYVEKKPGFDVEAKQLLTELRDTLGIEALTALRVINRYDVEGIDEKLFARCVPTVFSEPQVDAVYKELPADAAHLFAVEALPGQFDQRAASAAECVQLISQGERPTVRCAPALPDWEVAPTRSRTASTTRTRTPGRAPAANARATARASGSATCLPRRRLFHDEGAGTTHTSTALPVDGPLPVGTPTAAAGDPARPRTPPSAVPRRAPASSRKSVTSVRPECLAARTIRRSGPS